MKVLITGAYGQCGTALIDHLHEEHECRYLNRSDRPDDHPYGGYNTFVADITEPESMRPAYDGQDAVVHLAGIPNEAPFEDILTANIVGTYNVLEAAKQAQIESVVFGSTNHVVGMYETENAPALYELDSDVMIDHTDPVRPDSYYGTSKAFGENLGRYYVENYDYPKRFYALRIGNVSHEGMDDPYAYAEKCVADGEYERGSTEYEQTVARMKAMWQSRRDFAHMVDCCLRAEDGSFDVFYGVSDNDRRWLDIDHARTVIGYHPQDNGERCQPPVD